MSLPVPTALGRRERIWPAVAISVVVHGALIGWAVLRTRAPEIDLEQKPIVAKLVRLGEKRPEHYLPQKDAAPPPAPAAPKAAPAVATAPAPPTAPVPGAKPAPKQAAPAPTPPSAPARGSGTSLASVLSRVQQDADRQRWGDPNGDPEGDSDEGSEGDRYAALVQRSLQANYRVPATISDRERLYLKAMVVLFIEPDGRLSRWHIEKPSGNPAFDDALERTLRQTNRVPPPPREVAERYRSAGIGVLFQI
jgi:colicin import membrane protein